MNATQIKLETTAASILAVSNAITRKGPLVTILSERLALYDVQSIRALRTLQIGSVYAEFVLVAQYSWKPVNSLINIFHPKHGRISLFVPALPSDKFFGSQEEDSKKAMAETAMEFVTEYITSWCDKFIPETRL